MIINCIIIDDEKFLRESLANILSDNFKELCVIGKASNAKEARELLESNKVDLIFCDIKMPRENGFEFLQSIDISKYCFVFVTAHDEYAIQAIKAKAFDYVLKPIDVAELKITIESIKIHLVQRELKTDYRSSMLEFLNEIKETKNTSKNKIGINHISGTSLIDMSEICYLKGDGAYTFIHLVNGEKIIATRIIGDFEKILAPSDFLRIHKSIIVNLNFVKEIKKNLGLSIVLYNGTELSVSRRNAQILTNKFKEFAKII